MEYLSLLLGRVSLELGTFYLGLFVVILQFDTGMKLGQDKNNHKTGISAGNDLRLGYTEYVCVERMQQQV